MPCFLSVEPADWCMLACPECPVGQRRFLHEKHERHTMTPAFFSHVLDGCGRYLHTVQFFFQGEPLLNHDLPELIRIARQYDIYTIVSTNAQLLTPDIAESLVGSGINRIIVSIDGFSQASYEAYRTGGSFSRAIEGLRLLAEAKRRQKSHVVIEWQCLMLRSNQHEWKQIKQNCRQLGADRFSLKTAQFADFIHGNPLMPDNERYSRYRKTADGTFALKHKYRNRCLRLWSGAVIDARGNLLPCCFDKAGAYCFGNLASGSVRQLWHSPAADRFRRQLLTRRTDISICLNCTE